ncbi:MAG: GNAT family N-acetyltransferase [Bifidobacteriaceae bacterium]|jgi:L-amino acid N-acyltransferase YncA|nr:GNAT family N-acetyltransferase [Bifidobacteriaceae bacterium]
MAGETPEEELDGVPVALAAIRPWSPNLDPFTEDRGAPHMHIRPLLARDWEDVAAIMASSLGPAAFEDEVPSRDQWEARYLPGHRLVAANREGRVTGWAALEPVCDRPALAGVAMVSVFVEPGHRGQGFGRHLLTNLVNSADEAGLWTLQAYVAPPGTAAIQLLKDLGFRSVGRRERFARLGGVWHDAVVLERRSPTVFPQDADSTQEVPEAS